MHAPSDPNGNHSRSPAPDKQRWGVWCVDPLGQESGWLCGPDGTRDEYEAPHDAGEAAVLAQRCSTTPGWMYEPRPIHEEAQHA